jgi:hypothetical protein
MQQFTKISVIWIWCVIYKQRRYKFIQKVAQNLIVNACR